MKIILSTVVALFLLGCSDNSAEKATQHEVKSPMQTHEIVKKEPVKEEKIQEQHSLKKVVEVAPVKTEVVDEKIAIVEKKVVKKVDGASLFKACAACHGADGSKSALNKSQVIQGWDSAKVAQALHGYKDGTYGGAMKGIMKGQASKLSDDEIQALANYIAKL